MPSRKLFIIGCAAIAVALMSFAAPMAANAAILQSDYFGEATLGDTNWDNTVGTPLSLDTGNDQLDWNFRDEDGDSDAEWDLSTSSAGTADTKTWTISWDMQFGAWDDLTERQWIVLLFQGNLEQALEIQFKDGSINPRNDLLMDGETPVGYEVDAVLSDLALDTWIHVDLVFNRSGTELTSYNAGQDLADDGIDLWVDGQIGVSNMINEAAFQANGLDVMKFSVKGGSDKVAYGIFNDTVVSSGANVVVPEPATMSMLLMAIGGLALLLRRRR